MRRTKILSSLALATASIVCLIPAANAEQPIEEPGKISNTDVVVQVQGENSTVKPSVTSNSQIILVTSKETRTIDINGDNQISTIAEKYGIDLETYKNSEGKPVDAEHTLVDNEKLILFKSEMSGTSETIELTIPIVEKETDKLFIGEKEIKSEGKVGQALKTTIINKNLSADKKINTKSKMESSVSTNTRLTVITAPEPKIVLVGTKEKPAPVVVEENQENSNEINRDPISGEPLNNNESEGSTSNPLTTPSTLSPSLSGGMSGYSSANGGDVKASSKSSSEIISSNSTRGQKAVELAYTRLGSDYNWASSGDNAFDCSGLIHWIYKQNLGVDIPRTAKQQGSSAQQISLSQLQPGDLLWTNSHIGLYIGNGQMIHASRSNDQVVVSGIGWFVDDGARAARIR